MFESGEFLVRVGGSDWRTFCVSRVDSQWNGMMDEGWESWKRGTGIGFEIVWTCKRSDRRQFWPSSQVDSMSPERLGGQTLGDSYPYNFLEN